MDDTYDEKTKHEFVFFFAKNLSFNYNFPWSFWRTLMYMTEYYSALTKKEMHSLAMTLMNLEDIRLSDISQAQKRILVSVTPGI